MLIQPFEELFAAIVNCPLGGSVRDKGDLTPSYLEEIEGNVEDLKHGALSAIEGIGIAVEELTLSDNAEHCSLPQLGRAIAYLSDLSGSLDMLFMEVSKLRRERCNHET